MSRSRYALALLLVWLLPLAAPAEAPFRYPEGRHGKAELRYHDGLPVLTVEGTPEEIGEQVAALTTTALPRLLGFPKAYLKKFGFAAAWPALVQMSKTLEPNFPEDHRKEMSALAARAGIDREMVLVGNTLADIKKLGGCSVLLANPERSATGGPLFGRNLDYPTLGFLHEYSLVTVYRPTGKHAFASIGFPGFVGVLSGINDAGLAVAVLEVYQTKDNSVAFNPEGTPYSLCYRRLLEECGTVAEAEKLLRGLKRTTRNNLAVCDRSDGAIFEITPANLAVRRPEDGYCSCTNHFRSAELAVAKECKRYAALEQCRACAKLDLFEMKRLLHQANQGELTFQTMIFEPATLQLHLSIGQLPSSAQEMRLLDLRPLLNRR
jgi:hypothetical protein